MSETRLNELADEFIRSVTPHLGNTGRFNNTFYSYNAVSRAIFRLRIDVHEGKSITPQGEHFLAGASAVLAQIAVHSWRRRNFDVDVCTHPNEPGSENKIVVTAKRNRSGTEETYSQDFYRDMIQHLLKPAAYFPYCINLQYVFESLVLPSPELLYLVGTVLMQSPYSSGTWPQGPTPGGPAEDFEAARQLLIDDLHTDCGLPHDHAGMRMLSYWLVFPPIGWMQNDFGEYNHMTLFSQITEKQVLPEDQAFDYLRGLLRSQCLGIRNIAARTLMAYGQAPKDIEEARHYEQALAWRDHQFIEQNLLQAQARIVGDVELAENPEWVRDVREEQRTWADRASTLPAADTSLINDSRYKALQSLNLESVDEALKTLQQLTHDHPGSWTAKMLYSTAQLNGTNPEQGETEIRDLLKAECLGPEGHLRLGTYLKHSGRREEALELFQEAVKRWPNHVQSVDSCLWLLTDNMTE